jgi:hypothetical protein
MSRNPRKSGDFFIGENLKAGVYRLIGGAEMTRLSMTVKCPALVDNFHPFICIMSAK